MKTFRGFTLVEVITVTVIIAILATITTIVSSRQQIEARDASRSVKATLLAHALESYYDEKGEYPSPRGLTNGYAENTGAAVAAKLSIQDKTVLVMPSADTGVTNSIAAALGTEDVFAYVASAAIGNTNCQQTASGGCDGFTLTYKKELNSSIVTIESTYKTRPGGYDSPLEAPSKPTIAIAQSGTSLTATSSVPICSTTGSMTPRYSFRVQVAAGAWSAWSSWQAGTTYSRTGNTNATSYSFQVQVRCESATSISDTSVASDSGAITYYTPPAAPVAPTINAAFTSPYASGTSGTVSCDYGTAQYRIDWRTNDGVWTTGAWGTGLVANITPSDGVKYGFRSTARCINNTQTTTGSTGVEDTYVEPIAAPAAPTVSAGTFAGKTWTWTAAACPAGTTANYQYAFRTYAGSWTAGSWVGTGTGTSATNAAATSQGLAYDAIVHQNCTNAYATSGWGATGTGGYFYAPVVHARAEYWAMRLDAGAYPRVKVKTYNMACASGLVRELFLRVSWNQGAWSDANTSSWYSAPDNVEVPVTNQTVASGTMVEFGNRVRCRHPGTNYATDGKATPMNYDVHMYDIGNLYNKGSSMYATTCPAVSGQSSYCAGGYDTSDNKNTTTTSILECNIRATGIAGSTTNWSDRYAFGTASMCWN